MTVKRMDNVLIVVDDLEATKAFFLALGLRLEGEATVEGPEVGRAPCQAHHPIGPMSLHGSHADYLAAF